VTVVEEHRVPVSCECGAEDLRLRKETDGERRTVTLSCPSCSAVLDERREVLRTISAHLCGPGAPGYTSVGRAWVLEDLDDD
jgi:hypothetical protein